MSKCFIHLESLMDLDGGANLSEVKVEGDEAALGGMLEGAMNHNSELASLVVMSAVFYCTDRGIDLAEYQEKYRKSCKR